MADMTKVKKGIRLFLNILFVIVVAAAWGKEVDDPDAWFPEWVEEKEEPAQAPAQAEPDTRKEVSKQ